MIFINTSKDKQLDVFLIKDSVIADKISEQADYKVSERLLAAFARLLQSNKISLNQINYLLVVCGPGAFTSIRIAVAVANTLAYSLQIPVIGIINKEQLTNQQLIKAASPKLKKAKAGKYISPFYDQEPNITIAKKQLI